MVTLPDMYGVCKHMNEYDEIVYQIQILVKYFWKFNAKK